MTKTGGLLDGPEAVQAPVDSATPSTARGSPETSLSLIEAIVDAVLKLPEGVPPDVLERTIWTVLDGLGAMAFTSQLPQLRVFVDYAAGFGAAPSAAIAFTGQRATPEMAAAANAFLLHGSEIDDTDLRSMVHPTAVLLPPLLALAETKDCAGSQFLRALALAYTVQGRLGRSAQPLQHIGWMASAVYGPPSAAAAGGLLMQLGRREMVSAVALAAAAGGGLLQYYYDQTQEKRLEASRAARTAVESVRLAALGEIGAPGALDGQAGLYEVVARKPPPDPTQVVADLTRLEGPLHVMPKFYAAAEPIIALLDAIAKAIPPDVRPRQLRRFTVYGGEQWGLMLGDAINHFEAPRTKAGAMLNLSFVVALYLARRSTLVDDYESGLRDPEVLAAASKGAFEQGLGEREMSIEFELLDGRRLIAQAAHVNGLTPLFRERRLAKFESLADQALGGRAGELRDACFALPDAPSMRDWIQRHLRAAVAERRS